MLFFSALTALIASLPPIPSTHWMVMGAFSMVLTGLSLARKQTSVSGSIALGFTVFFGLFLIDALVLIRYWDIVSFWHGDRIDLKAEFDRLLNCGRERRIEMLNNILAFIPFGLFLCEYLSSSSQFRPLLQLGYVTLAAFLLSLFIECLQLFLHVGYFEVTDLVMNTLGAVIGCGVAIAIRGVLGVVCREKNLRTSIHN